MGQLMKGNTNCAERHLPNSRHDTKQKHRKTWFEEDGCRPTPETAAERIGVHTTTNTNRERDGASDIFHEG
jgi:hypothetical protein